MIASSIFLIAYGRKISGMEDEYLVAAETAGEGAIIGSIPGKFWVEYMPFLRYVPSWVPGNESKRIVEKYRPYVLKVRDGPYEEVKAAVVRSFFLGIYPLAINILTVG